MGSHLSSWQPDYRHFADVMANRHPTRLPLYEHLINNSIMERILDVRLDNLAGGKPAEQRECFRHYCRFFLEHTYDTVSFEVCLTEAFDGPHAIFGGVPGPIQSRADLEQYPWNDIPRRFWSMAAPRFDALQAVMPPGMKAVGGVGNGVFEIAEDLVGLEHLPFLQVDDPDTYAALFQHIGDTMLTIWTEFLHRYRDLYVACRIGDDLGFKSSLLTNPETVRRHIVPQYRRLIAAVHAAGKPFLWHSCGCVFEVMDDMIDAGIQAKHSNEDIIAPFTRWIEQYGNRIALVGGIDLNILCQGTPDTVFDAVRDQGSRFRHLAKGFALGSGNSIPDYVPLDNYRAMIRAGQAIRENETR